MIGNPVKGGRYVLRGLALLAEKKLRVFVLIPLIINILLFSIALSVLFNQLPNWIDSWLSLLPGFLSFLEFILYPLFALTAVLVVYYSFSILANILAAPFNGLLSERVEQMVSKREVADASFKELLAIIPRSIGREFAKLAYYIPRLILLLILSFIPGINLFAPLFWFLFGAWMMAIQYCDYPMDNNNVSFSAMRSQLKKQRFTGLGFGALVQLGMMVPILNFIMMPVAVIGATLYWIEEHS
ncbi:sulfate transporter CysZ ['Osedax' symbiont bacterium Rs2_46_30_T18]|nr:sulfate transporter CysZ ['Osedax' symbiont bacterium Rs2_46_30_T18]